MANLVSLSKRPSGGYTVTIEGSGIFEISSLQYSTNNAGVSLFNSNGNFIVKRASSFWTVGGVTNFTTNALVANALDLLGIGKSQSQQVDLSGNIVFPSGVPAKLTYELVRPTDIIAYTAGDAINSSVLTPLVITLPGASISNNGGGFAFMLKVESNITTMAGVTLRYWFFNATPSNIVGDNIPYINSYINSSKRCFYVDVTFDTLLAGSDTVIGSVELSKEYITAIADSNMYALIQTLTGFVPTSAGKIYSSLSILKLS